MCPFIAYDYGHISAICKLYWGLQCGANLDPRPLLSGQGMGFAPNLLIHRVCHYSCGSIEIPFGKVKCQHRALSQDGSVRDELPPHLGTWQSREDGETR